MRSQQDRRVEVLLFDDDEDVLPKLSETDGEDVYDGMTYARVAVPPMKSAKRSAVLLTLVSEDGLPLPGIEFDVLLDDETHRKGQLNDAGVATINVPPSAQFQVEYVDLDKIRATALAARLTQGLNNADAELVLGALCTSQREFELIKTVVDKYYPRSNPLQVEIQNFAKGKPSEDAIMHFLAGVSSGDPNSDTIVAYQEDDGGGADAGLPEVYYV